MAVSLSSTLTGSVSGISSFTPAQIALTDLPGLDPSVALPAGVMTRRPSSVVSFAVHPFQGEFGTIAIAIFDGMGKDGAEFARQACDTVRRLLCEHPLALSMPKRALKEVR